MTSKKDDERERLRKKHTALQEKLTELRASQHAKEVDRLFARYPKSAVLRPFVGDRSLGEIEPFLKAYAETPKASSTAETEASAQHAAAMDRAMGLGSTRLGVRRVGQTLQLGVEISEPGEDGSR